MLPLNPPQALSVAFIDGKGVEFLIWDGIPHQVAEIATTAEQAAIVLESLVKEMNRRLTFFRHARVRSLSQYNELAHAAGGETLPLMLIVIDEMTNLMVQTPGLAQTLTNHLVQLSSQGAALGLILVISTQNPKAEVINTLIRGNLSLRIAFRVAEANHSRTILGANVRGRGAHQISRTQRGRFMVRYDGDLVEMQGFKVDDDMARSIAEELRRNATIRARRLRLSRTPTPVRRDDSVDLAHYVGEAEPMPEGDLELEDIEWEVLRIARDEMDGALAINPLHDILKAQSVEFGYRRLRKFVQRLLDEGWVLEQSSSNDGRRCSRALIEQVESYLVEEPAQ
jgi:DNA segregation ATPase FtsK/SpoIIIE-like protein